ncbi:MAG TPA: Gmad2 immunoglobulin-like domain-containing protein [Candidatus Limnocylindrales bacterium]|nr:Gmad2 immunoglobulin-like domain-containing protein [Candidatus Limnocylindrales bacterium]
MKKLILLSAVIILALIIAWRLQPNPDGSTVDDKEVKAAGTFDECVKEGNPVLESYPPSCRTKEGKLITQNIGNENTLNDKIKIISPRPVEKIVSPLKITGEARGNWFFEAQFTAKLLGEKGEIIGEGIMTTDKEWMTEKFVPFSGEIEFVASSSAKGKLILEKANPSGLTENDETLIVPVLLR